MTLRPALRQIADKLLADSFVTGTLSLDDVGEALGALTVSSDEIDALLHTLEAAGRSVLGPQGGKGEAQLKRVLASARALTSAGERPSLAALAAHSGLSTSQVRHALALARIMQR